jgi:catechol 2,3-dioxygenase-like lactoylglutathione lyase family enzyme
MQSAELKDVIPILDVRDAEVALRFYVERLGFQVDFR